MVTDLYWLYLLIEWGISHAYIVDTDHFTIHNSHPN